MVPIVNNEEVYSDILYLLGKKYSVVENSNIQTKLSTEIENSQKEIWKKIHNNNPFYTNKLALNDAKNALGKGVFTLSSIQKDFDDYQELNKVVNIFIDKKFWNNEFKNLQDSEKKLNHLQNYLKRKSVKTRTDPTKALDDQKRICRTLLQREWEKSLDQEYQRWELSILQVFRQNLWEKLEEWLQLLQTINDLFANLSIDIGMLFDLSNGIPSLTDIEELKKWVAYISNDDGVKELCDLLGRLRRSEKYSRQELVETVSEVTDFVPDIDSREEIVGIRLGRDLEHALPHELALLGDEETSVLFDLKYIEGRLMCFDMMGMGENTFQITEQKYISLIEEEKLGPMIICIDTSGSMSGSPETIAKATTLFLATKAVAMKRKCFLINFSTTIETLDLSGAMGIEQVIKFLQKSFYGGTDVEPALNYALDMMNEEDYEKADVLVISDFVMSSITDTLQQKIITAKKKKNKFYSLAIGNLFLHDGLKRIFDNEWVYNPRNSSVLAIKSIVDTIQSE